MKWKKKCHLQLYYLPFNVSDFGVLSSTPLIWVTVSVCIVSDIFCAFFKSLRPCLCTRDNLVYNVVSRSIQIKWINVASEIKRVFEIWGTSDFWWSKYLERVECPRIGKLWRRGLWMLLSMSAQSKFLEIVGCFF